MLKNEIFIHYGHYKFDSNLFEPIKNREYFNKPFGGLWASPTIDKDVSWEEWCNREDFHTNNLNKYFKFKLKKNAKVLVIKEEKDLDKLPRTTKSVKSLTGIDVGMNEDIDFETLSKEYDAMLVYMYKEENVNYLHSIYFLMYGWDVDTLLVFNKDAIEELD